MATTLVYDFRGLTASVDADKVKSIYDDYVSAQGDEDKADSPDDAAWYEGQKYAYLNVLMLLHDTTAEKLDASGKGRLDPREIKAEFFDAKEVSE